MQVMPEVHVFSGDSSSEPRGFLACERKKSIMSVGANGKVGFIEQRGQARNTTNRVVLFPHKRRKRDLNCP